MLVVKVYATKKVPIREGESVDKRGPDFHVDLELIDEIQIQNVGKRDEDTWEYEIIKPVGLGGKILHFRKQGYRPLLRKVLGLLIGHKPGGVDGGG